MPEHRHYNRYDQEEMTHVHRRGDDPHYHEIDDKAPGAVGAAVFNHVPCPNCGNRLDKQMTMMGPNYFECRRCKEAGEICYQWERPGA